MRKDLGTRDVVDNEYQSAAAVVVGPVVEPFGREHRMLSRLHDSRALRAVGKAHDPLDAKQVGSALAGETPQSARKIEAADLAFEDDGKGVDAVRVGGGRLDRHRGSRGPAAGSEQYQTGIPRFGGKDALGAAVQRVEPADKLGAERR